MHKKETIRETDIDYKGLDDIISEIGGYVNSFRSLFGLIVLPFLYFAFIQSLTNDAKTKEEETIILKKYMQRVSFKGIYGLFDDVKALN